MVLSQDAIANSPYVILNAAMTVDGKIATATGDSKISSFQDLKRVHRLRASVGGILVGVRTIIADNPSLTLRYARGKKPVRIIADSNARTPPNARVIKVDPEVKTYICVSENASSEKIESLESAGAEILVCGKEQVDLSEMMRTLKSKSIDRILLEGGGKLNWSMLSNGLVDEVSVALSPLVIGGERAITLADGEGVRLVKEGIKLSLKKISRYGQDLVLFYRVSR